MTTVLETLGVPGVAIVAAWIITVGYWSTRPFRPDATWFTDLRHLTARLRPGTPRRRREVVIAHGLWPRADTGPRMWRWPLNSTRWFCAGLWAVVNRRGLLGLIGRTAWYPSAALGAAAAITQALILVTLITLPVAAVLLVVDSATVIRGGLPPARPSHVRKAGLAAERRTRQYHERLATIRAELQPAPRYQR